MWLLVALAAVPVPVLTETLPADVPALAVRWERVQGDAVGPSGSRVRYALLVEPMRLGIWAITRFRIHLAGKDDPEDEMIVWHARVRDTRCYQRVRRSGDASPPTWEWQVVPSGTDAFRQAMSHALEIYQLNRARERLEEKARGE